MKSIVFFLVALLSFATAQRALVIYSYRGSNCDSSNATFATFFLLTSCGNNGTHSASIVKNGNNMTLTSYTGISCSGNPFTPLNIAAYDCYQGVSKAVFADALERAPTSNDTVTYNYFGRSCSGDVSSGGVTYGTQCSTTAKPGCVVYEGSGTQTLCGNGGTGFPSIPSTTQAPNGSNGLPSSTSTSRSSTTQVLVNFAIILVAAIFAL